MEQILGNNQKRVLEKEIQTWLENDYENILQNINGIEYLDSFNKNIDDNIPEMSLDFFIHQKFINSAKYVKDNLYLLDLITNDDNVSTTKGEILRPDLLLFNNETNTFIVVEIKREHGAERQAVSELLAYEHEIQNLMPFMSKTDIVFIIISADYRTLLEHSVSSLAIWQNKKILPLKISGIDSSDSSKWNLSFHKIDSWSLLSHTNILPEQISTAELVLYDKDAYNPQINVKDKKDNIYVINKGLELIIKEAERNNISGFVILIKNTVPTLDLNNYSIVIGVVNHFSFLEHIEDNSSKIKDYFLNDENFFGFDNHLQDIPFMDNSLKYLKNFYNPEYEGFDNWSNYREQLEENSTPIKIDFFGEIDSLVTQFALNKTVLKSYFPELSTGLIDFSYPNIGINILDNLFKDNIFIYGEFRVTNIYQFGKIVGELSFLYQMIDGQTNKYDREFLLGKIKWLEIEFFKSYRETAFRYVISEDISKPPTFKVAYNNYIEAQENISKVIDWFVKDFLNSSVYQEAFMLGFSVMGYFKNDSIEMVENIKNEIINFTKKHIQKDIYENLMITEQMNELKKLINLDDNFDFEKVDKRLIIENFEDSILKIIDSNNFPVYHKVVKQKIKYSEANKTWLKDTYIKEYQKKDRCVISLEANGSLAIKHIIEDVPFLNVNPENEVIFSTYTELELHRKISWQEFFNELEN